MTWGPAKRQQWRAKNRDHLNAYKREWRRRQKEAGVTGKNAASRLPKAPASGDLPEPVWESSARCRHEPHPDFYSPKVAELLRAKQFCAGCPVAAECLAAALERDEHGVWGGTTWAERQLMGQGAA